MSDEKVGIDSLKKAMDLCSKNIALGIKIGKDGVNAADIAHVPEALANLQELAAFIGENPQVVKELQDLDLLEGGLLIQKALEEYQEVKEAVK